MSLCRFLFEGHTKISAVPAGPQCASARAGPGLWDNGRGQRRNALSRCRSVGHPKQHHRHTRGLTCDSGCWVAPNVPGMAWRLWPARGCGGSEAGGEFSTTTPSRCPSPRTRLVAGMNVSARPGLIYSAIHFRSGACEESSSPRCGFFFPKISAHIADQNHLADTHHQKRRGTACCFNEQ